MVTRCPKNQDGDIAVMTCRGEKPLAQVWLGGSGLHLPWGAPPG